ncbi:MAG: FGGY-family carbohydrate kinase [Defluviitaleaceae bacterium]|nr:FGGY-family carbohydrate kinase [Defluviitaleaceae bacterium]
MRILVLESSTTSAKAMIYDTDTKSFFVDSRAYEFTDNKTDAASIGEQDPRQIFSTTIEVGRQLCLSKINSDKASRKKIDIIALVNTFHSVMLCDRQMNPQTPLYQWHFTGASSLCRELRHDEEYTLKFYKKTGCMVNSTYPFFKLKLLRQNGWALEKYNIMGQGTYNTYRLTGSWVVPDVTVSGSGLLNTHTRDYDDELLKELSITRENLGALVRYNAAQTLSAEGAALLGLEPGILVLPSIADGAMNQIGSGALAMGTMTFSVGTSGAMRLSVPNPVIPDKPSTWCYLSPHAWMSGAATPGCTNCVDWFKTQFFDSTMNYEKIEENLSNLSDYSNSAVFLPFLFGERCIGWKDDRLGGFVDIRPHHTSYDLYYSVLEGVLLNLYQCYEALTKVSGVPQKVKLSGGILNSRYWLQMCADIFQIPMEIDHSQHGSIMGGVAIAMEKLGVIPSLLDIELPIGNIVQPNPYNSDMYRQRYERFLHWYEISAN